MSRIVVVLLAVMVGSTLAACSEAPSADVAAFCDSALMVERNFNGETDFDALAAALDAAESGAPSEIEDAVRTVVGVITPSWRRATSRRWRARSSPQPTTASMPTASAPADIRQWR